MSYIYEFKSFKDLPAHIILNILFSTGDSNKSLAIDSLFEKGYRSVVIADGVGSEILHYVIYTFDEMTDTPFGTVLKYPILKYKIDIFDCVIDNTNKFFIKNCYGVNNKYLDKEIIHLHALTPKTNPDWYGDWEYENNPLSRFSICKKHCYVIEKRDEWHVYTTMDFINYMGWEDFILDYKVKE